jgi:tripartite-type tricarboxylate transporter receptor subunit TctC
LPAEIVQRLHKDLRTVMGAPKMKESLEALGTDPWMLGPDELARVIREESAKWGETVKRSGAKAE